MVAALSSISGWPELLASLISVREATALATTLRAQMCSFSLTNSNIFSTSGHHIFKPFSVTSQCKYNHKTNIVMGK
ncbi:hypothetical protein E2C01_006458 [Portunus trituberculatus]|uniref:Uncharacterized protein n=1 Tax=Portunus trituberculatus TaxID=210409 RepID=A0A5B7CY90_PORTR|nr:hypothetical protein [Portunus trituberculatus]